MSTVSDFIKDQWTSVLAIGAFVLAVWTKLGVNYLHAQWDGFKLEYDKLNRSDANKEGRLDEQADARSRADRKEKDAK